MGHVRLGVPLMLALMLNRAWYAETLVALHKNPGCIGFHLCRVYQRNKARRRGLLDGMKRPNKENVDLIQTANEKITQLMKRGSK